jgi:hypothetical protein
MNWIIEEAKKINSNKNRVILENPKALGELDNLLLHTYYPFIQDQLKETGYKYMPKPDDIKIGSSWDMDDLQRSLTFMLFDDFNYSFFRGVCSCSKNGFFLEKNFFLGLPKDTNPDFLFRILSEEKFSGNPPNLSIETSEVYPEGNTYYHITLNSGDGFQFGEWTLQNAAKGNIEAAIHDSIDMYENSMIEGFSSMEEVEDFIKIALRCYEAY